MNTEELRRRAAERVKWDKATLHQKMGETVDLIESMRKRLDNGEDVPADEIRVLLNELTRRTAVIDICRDRFPTEKHRIGITLNIADAWISNFSIVLKARRSRSGSSTRNIIEQGFPFMPDKTRAAMLKAYDEGQAETAQKVRTASVSSKNSKEK